MRTYLAATVVLLALAAGCTAADDQPDTAQRSTPVNTSRPPQQSGTPSGYPSDPQPRRSPLPTQTPAAHLRAGDLQSHTRCGPAGSQNAIADLTWQPATTSGSQRVVYSPYADGYRTGRYEQTADLPAATKTVTVESLSPGSVYTWLVLTKQGDTWQASGTARFDAPICVADHGTGG